MKLSVVIVTYNRPIEVELATRSLLNQSIRPFEVIVIDDASNPPLQLNLFDPIVRIVRFDDEIGASKARNYGISSAKGDYVAFIDDDAIASKHWVAAVKQGICCGAEVLGGPLTPIYRAKPPVWWSEKDIGYFVGVGNLAKREIWGANMVFKKEVFQKIGFFDPKLGPQKGKHLNGEDTYLIDKAKAQLKVAFLPEANVFHIVMPNRLTLRYIFRWAYYSGKSQRIVGGPGKLAFVLIVKALLEFFNPFSKIGKAGRVKRVAVIAEQFGALI